jgi:hypothetical protein
MDQESSFEGRERDGVKEENRLLRVGILVRSDFAGFSNGRSRQVKSAHDKAFGELIRSRSQKFSVSFVTF